MEDRNEAKRNESNCIRGPCESHEVDGLDMMLSRGVENGIRDLGSHQNISTAVRA